jgi:hypothetical protein
MLHVASATASIAVAPFQNMLCALVCGSPIQSKLRFLAQHNISTDLEVRVKSNWNLNHQRLEHLIAAMNHVPEALRREGMNMEYGTREGLMLRFLAQYELRSPLRGLPWHAFDSFEGLPDDLAGGDLRKTRNVRWRTGAYSTNGQLPNMTCCPNVQLHKGWFNDTVGPFLDAHVGTPVGFAHMDADIYSSTMTVLEAIFSRCAQRIGTVFAFDELFGSLEQEQHELRALEDSATKWGIKWRFITYALTRGSTVARAAVQVVEPDVRGRCRTSLRSVAPSTSGEAKRFKFNLFQ